MRRSKCARTNDYKSCSNIFKHPRGQNANERQRVRISQHWLPSVDSIRQKKCVCVWVCVYQMRFQFWRIFLYDLNDDSYLQHRHGHTAFQIQTTVMQCEQYRATFREFHSIRKYEFEPHFPHKILQKNATLSFKTDWNKLKQLIIFLTVALLLPMDFHSNFM